MDCLFCKIIKGEIPSKKVYENEFVYAFEDIAPQAPFHVLIIPKEHIASSADITADNSILVAKIFEAAAQIAKENDLKDGFRIVTNSGKVGCQTVFHMHFHMLSGRQLEGQMG
ncbi:MAG: histidine triad nucleotide-binding protein [Clostridia bacterium]|nr:histidine triad nucleotide-binding protein [Clostridia bacterium]